MYLFFFCVGEMYLTFKYISWYFKGNQTDWRQESMGLVQQTHSPNLAYPQLWIWGLNQQPKLGPFVDGQFYYIGRFSSLNFLL